jgi:hypothetical protein
MMSKGFITTADFQKNENSEIEITELQVRDLEIGAPNDEDQAIIVCCPKRLSNNFHTS